MIKIIFFDQKNQLLQNKYQMILNILMNIQLEQKVFIISKITFLNMMTIKKV